MNSVCKRLLTLFIYIRYPKIPGQYRWFLRFYYLGSLNQLRYLKKDFFVRKPYREVKFFGEFQQELLYVLPHAYWHFKNGTLQKTVSAKDTTPFYFFSPNHEERFISRKWRGNYNISFPNAPHNHKLNRIKWRQIPLKAHYTNNKFIFEKPILVIANRFNTEWENSPISYFDIDCLDRLICMLEDDFQIIYNRPESYEITNDNSEIRELNEKQFIKKKYPNTIILSDIHRETDYSFNELQLRIYANCSNFISIHGGTATLASYFGGRNVIFSKRGHEHYLKEFENIFPKLAGTRIYHVKSYPDLFEKVKSVFDAN
ncbi:MAG: hypothetical protein AAGC64_05340 [Bacteroidota bacterium]